MLILHGQNDPVTPIEDSRTLAKENGRTVRLIELPGQGHTLRGEAAIRRILDAELAFLEALG